FSQPLAFFGTQVAFTDVFAQILEHGTPPKDYRRERNRSLSPRRLHSSYYWPVMPGTRRLFRAEGGQFWFVCYPAKVRFLVVTWAARLTAGASEFFILSQSGERPERSHGRDGGSCVLTRAASSLRTPPSRPRASRDSGALGLRSVRFALKAGN